MADILTPVGGNLAIRRYRDMGDGTFAEVIYSAPPDLDLLTNASATGDAVTVLPAGYYNWSIWGTWDGASASLQWSPDGITYINIDGVTASDDGGYLGIPISSGLVRVEISTPGAMTSLNSGLGGVS